MKNLLVIAFILIPFAIPHFINHEIDDPDKFGEQFNEVQVRKKRVVPIIITMAASVVTSVVSSSCMLFWSTGTTRWSNRVTTPAARRQIAYHIMSNVNVTIVKSGLKTLELQNLDPSEDKRAETVLEPDTPAAKLEFSRTVPITETRDVNIHLSFITKQRDTYYKHFQKIVGQLIDEKKIVRDLRKISKEFDWAVSLLTDCRYIGEAITFLFRVDIEQSVLNGYTYKKIKLYDYIKKIKDALPVMCFDVAKAVQSCNINKPVDLNEIKEAETEQEKMDMQLVQFLTNARYADIDMMPKIEKFEKVIQKIEKENKKLEEQERKNDPWAVQRLSVRS